MEELEIPSIVLSTKDKVLLPIGETYYMYKIVFDAVHVQDFWVQNSKTC